MSNYKGTSVYQDGRFKNKEKLLLESKTFPKEFEEKIDISKVELKVIRSWIDKRLNELLGFEDEFLGNFIISLLEEKTDPRKIHLQITGFLNKDTFKFMEELWSLLISAQNSENGIPFKIIEEKKEELK